MSLLPFGYQSGMFFDAPVRSVADCLTSWGLEVGRGTVAKRAKMTLPEAFEFVSQRKFTPTRAFLIQFAGKRCAFFNNHSQEFLAQAEIYNVCRLLHVQGYFFSFNHLPESEQRGTAHFVAARFENGEVLERQVMSYNESGWVFSQSGEPLPYERLDIYESRKKKDRLTDELLHAYGEAANVPFWDESSYGTEVVLLSWGQKLATQESTLKKLMRVLGRPAWIMDRHGVRRPPD